MVRYLPPLWESKPLRFEGYTWVSRRTGVGRRVPAESNRSGHDIVVIGASAGGVEALGEIVAELPGDLAASVFVVLHIPPSGTSVLPVILMRRGELPASHAVDEEQIRDGHIYIAPPDHHLFLQSDSVRVIRGPKENGYRPAIDPLFRSAARSFGPRVVGLVLSGVLDDGTAGLAVIKAAGGRTLVQDPGEALYPNMPSSAIEFVMPDRVLRTRELARAIVELADEPASAVAVDADDPLLEEDHEEFIEIDRGASESPQAGNPSGFTCPECGGALWESDDAGVPRFRCRTGHGFSPEALLAGQSDIVEVGLWEALRALEERAAMARRMAARARSRGHRLAAARFEKQANAAVDQGVKVRRALRDIVPELVTESLVETR
jgi:two-component system, chemotaxis family, protein-glutamate methylesterase/glutaminase